MKDRESTFCTLHPVVLFFYFLSMGLITMFVLHPLLIALSLLGGMLFALMLEPMRKFLSNFAFYLLLLLFVSLVNPLFSHMGATPLFFLNGNPITLEAFFYGLTVAGMMIAVLIWCACFGRMMTSDKVLYLFGHFFFKLSLVLSISIRFLPLFKQRWREVHDAQTAMGYCSERGFTAKVVSMLHIFSALVGWSLESSVETGASMRARGYGLGGRTHFSLFAFGRRDGFLLALMIALTALTFAGVSLGSLAFSFYPRTPVPVPAIGQLPFFAGFAFLAFLPFILELMEALRWKFLRSKI